MAETPSSLKGIGYLYMIIGAASFLVTLSAIPNVRDEIGKGNTIIPVALLLGILAMFFAEIYIGWSLVKLKSWSRIAATLVALLFLIELFSGSIVGPVGIAALYVLWFDKTAAKAFEEAKKKR